MRRIKPRRRAALEAAGIGVEETDDPLVNLLAISIDKSYPFDVRMKAMVEALPYVHARKTENVNINNTRYVVALPDGEISMEEWQRRVRPAEQQIEDTKH